MGQILELLAGAATVDVRQEAYGLTWRVRAVRSSDLVAVGYAAIVGLGAGEAPSEPGADLAGVAERLRSLSAEQVQRLAGFQEALVCAGVVGLASDALPYEEITVVLDPRGTDKERGRLYVGDLPPGTVVLLADRILDLSTNGPEAAERLRAFRARPMAAGDL